MSEQTEEIVDLYREYNKIPTVASARLSNVETAGHVQVQSYWTQRDLERNEKVKFCQTHIVHYELAFSTPPVEVKNEQWCKESPSGKFRAVIRKLKDKKGEDKQYVEIWEHDRKVQNIPVSNLEQHGQIYDPDGIFGGVSWNQAETHLLYVAEKKAKKTKSFFDKKPTKKPEAEDESRGEEFDFKDHWGEQLKEKREPVVCVLDIESGITSVLDNIPDNVSAAQAVWTPDDMGVVCVGFYNDPYRLGIIYCPIRKSALFYIDLKTSQCTMLGGSDKSIRCPVFSPDGTKLIYLENEIGGPHMQCSVLKMIDWPTKGIVTVVDRVKAAIGPDFPGIYCATLNSRCWANDSKRMLIHTFWRSKRELVLINTETGEVTRLTEDHGVGSWTVLDVKNDLVVAACESPNVPNYIVIGNLPEVGKERNIKWQRLDEGDDVMTGALKELSWRMITIDVPKEMRHPKYESLDFECILLEPKKTSGTDKKSPLVVFPHGGPHSTIPAQFIPSTAMMAGLGYAVLMVNYRGSLGFGQDNIDSLLGRVGTQDVQDCKLSLDKVLSMDIVDKDKLAVYGGSHGGFLTTHLIGQYPDLFKAAVARNPVTNIASMVNTTDIPDWCFVEAGLAFDAANTSGPKAYEEMWNRSPIRYVDDVKAPILILLGEEDLRVPPKQGQEYYKALRARGKTTRCLSYAMNNHPIANVDAEADAFVNMMQWFNTHLGL